MKRIISISLIILLSIGFMYSFTHIIVKKGNGFPTIVKIENHSSKSTFRMKKGLRTSVEHAKYTCDYPRTFVPEKIVILKEGDVCIDGKEKNKYGVEKTMFSWAILDSDGNVIDSEYEHLIKILESEIELQRLKMEFYKNY